MPPSTTILPAEKSNRFAALSRLSQVTSQLAAIHASVLGFKKRDVKAVEKTKMQANQSRQDRNSSKTGQRQPRQLFAQGPLAKTNPVTASILSKKSFQLECSSYPHSESTSASDIDLTPVQRSCRMKGQRNTERQSDAYLEQTVSTQVTDFESSGRSSLAPPKQKLTVGKFRALPTPKTTKICFKTTSQLGNDQSKNQREFTLFRDSDLRIGQSDLSDELVVADIDDDVQSEFETVNNAKLSLEFDLREAIKQFCGEKTKRGKVKLIENLELFHK